MITNSNDFHQSPATEQKRCPRSQAENPLPSTSAAVSKNTAWTPNNSSKSARMLTAATSSESGIIANRALAIFPPLSHRTKKFHWHLSDATWIEPVEFFETLLENIDAIPKNNFFQNRKRRLIFSWSKTGDQDNPHLLAKCFPAKSIKDKLRYPKSSIAETSNLVTAKQRGLPVPIVHALGLRHSLIGSSFSVVIMDYLPYPSMHDLLFTLPEERDREKLLKRANPIIKMLYSRGANHIDLSTTAILLSREALGMDCVIDWQHANFIDGLNPILLASLAGLLGRSIAINHNWLPTTMVHSWFLELLEELEIEQSPILLEIFERNLQERLSTTIRLNLPHKYY